MEKVRSFSLLIMIFVFSLLPSYIIYYHFNDNGDVYLEDNIESSITEKISTNNVEKINNKENSIKGIVTIPKIKLRKSFYDINSKENDVNKNICVLKESIMPDSHGSTLFLAAHSGNSNVSYFKNLHLLKIDDEVIIDYNNHKYYYIVNNIYEMEKNGKISVTKNINETHLVLTTCSENKGKQLIVVSKLFQTI